MQIQSAIYMVPWSLPEVILVYVCVLVSFFPTVTKWLMFDKMLTILPNLQWIGKIYTNVFNSNFKKILHNYPQLYRRLTYSYNKNFTSQPFTSEVRGLGGDCPFVKENSPCLLHHKRIYSPNPVSFLLVLHDSTVNIPNEVTSQHQHRHNCLVISVFSRTFNPSSWWP